MTNTEREAAVLAYYGREASGIPEPAATPLAGLPLAGFRSTRQRLVAKGLLVRTIRGRYAPVAA